MHSPGPLAQPEGECTREGENPSGAARLGQLSERGRGLRHPSLQRQAARESPTERVSLHFFGVARRVSERIEVPGRGGAHNPDVHHGRRGAQNVSRRI